MGPFTNLLKIHYHNYHLLEGSFKQPLLVFRFFLWRLSFDLIGKNLKYVYARICIKEELFAYMVGRLIESTMLVLLDL